MWQVAVQVPIGLDAVGNWSGDILVRLERRLVVSTPDLVLSVQLGYSQGFDWVMGLTLPLGHCQMLRSQ